MKKLDWKSIVVTLLAIVLLIYIFSLIEFGDITGYVEDHKMIMLFLIILYFSISFLRIYRNYVLFKQNDFFSSDTKILRFLPQGMVAGVFATYGPLKSGELVAIEIYRDYFDIDRGQSLAVIIVGRIIDVVLVLALVTSGIFVLSSTYIASIQFYLFMIVIILSITFVILLSEKLGMYVLGIIEYFFVWKLSELFDRIKSIVTQYYQSLQLVSNRKSQLTLVLVSLLRWILDVTFYLLIFYSLNFELTFLQVLPVVGFSYAIGVSSGTPGALGTSQLTALTILQFYGISQGVAALSIIILTSVAVVSHGIFMSSGQLISLIYKDKVVSPHLSDDET